MDVQPVTLTGRFVRLEPLQSAHASALFAVATPEIFEFMRGRPVEWSAAGFAAYVERAIHRPSSLAFVILRQESGQPVGVTGYLNIASSDRGIEVGGTWIGPDYQGTEVNPDSKLLLLHHAFETLGAIRVAIVTDSRNLQSQRAIEKLGAVREGVLRKYKIMPDGYQRDTVVYSITDDEWPVVRTALEARLGLSAGQDHLMTGDAMAFGTQDRLDRLGG